MVQGLLLPECSFTAPRYAVHGVPQTTQRPRGRSRSRQAVRSAASPEKQGQNVPQNSREAPTSSGFPARSLSPTKRSAESRNVAVSATSSAQAQVTGQLANLWGAYSKRLEVDPVRTKALTSFAGFMIGDFLAQRIGQEPFDPLRCLRLGAYGLFLDGPVGHWWYKVLDKNVMPDKSTSTPAVLLKTAADQLVWAPIMTVVFFAVLKSLEGHPELILSTVQDKLVKTVVANYVLWPGAHFINFKFVPSQHRILYNNCVSVIWSAYLSLAAHGLVGIGDPCSVYPTTWDEAVQYMICTADIKEDLLKGKIVWNTFLSLLFHDLPEIDTDQVVGVVTETQRQVLSVIPPSLRYQFTPLELPPIERLWPEGIGLPQLPSNLMLPPFERLLPEGSNLSDLQLRWELPKKIVLAPTRAIHPMWLQWLPWMK